MILTRASQVHISRTLYDEYLGSGQRSRGFARPSLRFRLVENGNPETPSFCLIFFSSSPFSLSLWMVFFIFEVKWLVWIVSVFLFLFVCFLIGKAM